MRRLKDGLSNHRKFHPPRGMLYMYIVVVSFFPESNTSSEASPRPVSVPGFVRPLCSQAIQGSMRGDPRYMVHYTDNLLFVVTLV